MQHLTLDEPLNLWYTSNNDAAKGGVSMILTALEASVATGDNRNIMLWIIVAAVALILIVLSAAMAAMKKQEEKKKSKRKSGNAKRSEKKDGE